MGKLVTNKFKRHKLDQFIESITERANTNYYVFVGQPTPYTGGDANVAVPTNSLQDVITDTYDEMVFGKRVTASDVAYMTKRYVWTSGTVYAQYDDTDTTLDSKAYYVAVDEKANFHVYLCLNNNNGSASTEQPRYNDTSPDDTFFQTSDGYEWRYMYTVPKTTWDKFSTKDYMPVVNSAAASGNAVAGAIDHIEIVSGGQRYDNHISGRFDSTDLRVSGNTLLYSISANGSSVNGFYTGSVLYITEGTGKGQYKTIDNYLIANTSKRVVVNSAFSTALDTTSRYEITPKVKVYGSGNETADAEARALINTASSNTVYKIEMLSRGAGYTKATANVFAASNVGVTNTASLQVVIPPFGGHASDPVKELAAKVLCVSVDLSNSENSTVSTNNDFRTIGLMRNPLFANVNINIVDSANVAGSDGTFLANEGVLQHKRIKLVGTADVNTTTNVATGTSTEFTDSFEANDYIIVSTGTASSLHRVSSITNTTSLILSSNCLFTNSTASIYKVVEKGTANVKSLSSGAMDLTNVNGAFTTDSRIIGLTTGATANISTLKINNITKNFDTFSQLHRVGYSSIVGSFEDDEVIYQSNIIDGATVNTTAFFHSVDTSAAEIKLTGKFGALDLTETITGNSSGATIEPSEQFIGDVIHGSGEVLYIENIEPITRADNQSETIKIIVEY